MPVDEASKMNTKKPRSTSEILLEILCRFLGSAIFGAVVSAIVFFSLLIWGPSDISIGKLQIIFWSIPLIWGVLGIFWFDAMLDYARDFIEQHFHYE